MLKPQEPPYDRLDSCKQFQPGSDKPFLATSGAIEKYGYETSIAGLRVLRQNALEYDGIDYLQVFETSDGERVWFIEDGDGGAITALLPEEYWPNTRSPVTAGVFDRGGERRIRNAIILVNGGLT